jgi:carboxymethylenebutenolidase
MGLNVVLTAADGFRLGGYVAQPAGSARGGVVILPEIFGVNSHIRSVADQYAALGYLAIAPAMFDRAQPGLDLGYSDEEVKAGQALMKKLRWDDVVLDVTAAARHVSSAGNVGLVGFCWGGTAAWVAASRGTGYACAVSYYGNAIVTVLEDRPRIPMLLHWGANDHLIQVADIRRIEALAPEVQSHLYDTGHGFNCEQRTLYHAPSAALARQRTVAFLSEHVG